MQHTTKLYSVYVSTAYEYIQQGQRFKRKKTKKIKQTFDSFDDLFYQISMPPLSTAAVYTRQNKRESLCDWLDTLHTT